MQVARSFALSVAILLVVSTVASAAPRSRHRSETAYGSYGAQGATARPPARTYDGYSADPETARLQRLADHYRPGW